MHKLSVDSSLFDDRYVVLGWDRSTGEDCLATYTTKRQCDWQEAHKVLKYTDHTRGDREHWFMLTFDQHRRMSMSLEFRSQSTRFPH